MHAGSALVAPELVEAFRRDGFVVVPGLLTPAELSHFGKCVDAAVAARQRGRPPLEERSRYEQSFLQSINLWEDHPDVRPLTFHPRACAAAVLRAAPGKRCGSRTSVHPRCAKSRPTVSRCSRAGSVSLPSSTTITSKASYDWRSSDSSA